MTTLNTYAARGANAFIPTLGQGMHISEGDLLATRLEVQHNFILFVFISRWINDVAIVSLFVLLPFCFGVDKTGTVSGRK